LSEAQANELALEATKGEKWLARKFVKFCVDYCRRSELREPDRVFMLPEFLTPAEADFEGCLKRIYKARSRNLHAAQPFPPGVGIGTGPMVSLRGLSLDPLARVEIPPVTWFERVVSTAARRYLLAEKAPPFLEYGSGKSQEP
jgi:hypothetical protein